MTTDEVQRVHDAARVAMAAFAEARRKQEEAAKHACVAIAAFVKAWREHEEAQKAEQARRFLEAFAAHRKERG